MKRVLLGEDHVIFRQCLALSLDRINPGLKVVGQAGSLVEARARMEADRVDIVVVGLPDGEGVDLIRELHEADPPVPVLVLTRVFDPAWHAKAREAGAEELLTTAASIEEIISTAGRLKDG